MSLGRRLSRVPRRTRRRSPQEERSTRIFARPATGRMARVSRACFPISETATVKANDPSTVLRVILQGAQTVSTDREPTGPAMPAFGWQLSDAQIAAVASYVRDHFGKAPTVSESDVRKARTEEAARTN